MTKVKGLNLCNATCGVGRRMAKTVTPEKVSRLDREFLENGSKKLTKLFAAIFFLFLLGVGNVWGTDVAVGDTLIIENFKDGSSQTDWSKTSANYSSTYSSITMKVSGDASSISLSASNAKVSTVTAANMDGSNVWLNKSTDGYIEIDNIPLHNVTKFQAHWAQSAKVAVTFYYKFNGDASWTSGGASSAAANADATSNAITVTSGKTSVSIKFQRANNTTNQRLDKVHLVVTQVAATKTLSSIAITTQPTKRAYLVGQTFSSTGAVVTATYSDATTANVSASATWTPTTGLTSGSNTITASYTESGVTKTTNTTVTGYTVTVQVKDVDGNTLSGVGAPTASATGASITASESGNNYVFKRWVAVTAAGTSFADASNRSTTLSGTPTGAVTIKAEYYKPITITYKANGSTFTTQTYARGGTLAFPVSNPDGATYSCTGKTFVGWVGEANKDYSHASSAPTYATAGGSVTTDATYYAVFATAGAGGSGNIQLSYSSLSLTTSYESGSTKSVSDVDFYCYNIMTGNSGSDGYQKIQFKKTSGGAGYIYNSEILPGNITSIVFGSTTRDLTVNFGDSSDPDGSTETTTCSSGSLTATPTGNYKYFKIINSVDYAAYTGTITINYSSVSYSEYQTGCCTELGQPATLELEQTAYTIKATWTATSGGNETGYSVQLYDNSGGDKGSTIGDPISRTSSQLTYTFEGLTANHKYYVGVTPTYSGAGDFCATGTEKLVSVTTDQVYTVTYNGGGGSGTITDSNSPYEAGDEVTVKENTFTKSGYTFTAWSYSPEVTVTDGKFVMPSSNVEITATWTAKKNYYIDRMHGNCDGVNTIEVDGVVYNCYLKEAQHTTPDLSDDATGSNTCVTVHEHFLGWVVASKIGAQGQLLSGYTIIKGGVSNTAGTDGTIYYAVWAEE